VATENQATVSAGLSYAELEKLNALRDAARTSGNLAGAGLQFGAGAQLGARSRGPARPGAPRACCPGRATAKTQAAIRRWRHYVC
jgi:hypothetical protein